VAGACATIVKAWFDDNAPLSAIAGINISQPSEDGFSLPPYSGADRDKLTIGGEMNKLAANIGLGRNHAAVHWRYDCADSLPLGEAVTISVLRDMGSCWNEPFAGFPLRNSTGRGLPG
jgi:hypothetical protein